MLFLPWIVWVGFSLHRSLIMPSYTCRCRRHSWGRESDCRGGEQGWRCQRWRYRDAKGIHVPDAKCSELKHSQASTGREENYAIRARLRRAIDTVWIRLCYLSQSRMSGLHVLCTDVQMLKICIHGYMHLQFLANVNSCSRSLYVVVHPSVCLSVCRL